MSLSSQAADAAFGKWPGILSSLGIDSKYLVDRHGPCPMCGGKDRFRFADRGNGKWFCNQCTNGDGFDLLAKLNGWPPSKAFTEVLRVAGETLVATKPAPERSEGDKREWLLGLYKASAPIQQGDPAWNYLERRCGPLNPSQTRDLRYHPSLKHSITQTHMPALLQAMRPNGAGGQTTGYQRLFLTPDGRKAAVDPVRMTCGECGIIRLTLPAEHLGIAEGLETALCAAARFDLPVWSAVSAAGMKGWEPPPGTLRVSIFGDNDESYTGQEAAYSLAFRLRRTGLQVAVLIPTSVGTDWADAEVAEVA